MLNVGEQSPIGVPEDLAVDLEQQELELKMLIGTWLAFRVLVVCTYA